MLFGLQWRDQLTPNIANELDSLINKISGFLSVAHNEDGTLKDTGKAVGPSVWTDVPFNAGMFTGENLMTWVPDHAYISYKVTDDTMDLTFYIPNTVVGGTAELALQLAVPGGYQPHQQTFGIHIYNDDGGNDTIGTYEVSPASKLIKFYKITVGVWTVPATLTTIRGQASFRVTR